jgi:hypothetical protein
MLTKLNDEGALALLVAIFLECPCDDVMRWNNELGVYDYRFGLSEGKIPNSQLDQRPNNPVKYFGQLREL